MDSSSGIAGAYIVDRFRIDPVTRSVTCGGARVPLTPRLFDTLLEFVQHPGVVIDRDALLDAVWPGRQVDDGSVVRAVSSLRAVLKEHGGDEDLIVTVPGRGYRLARQVGFTTEPEPAELDSVEPPPTPVGGGDVEAPPARLAGRRLALPAALAALLVVALLAAVIGLAPRPGGGIVAPENSVAVLPFRNLGPGEDADIADGLADELINALGRIGNLHVSASRSSFRFRAADVPVAEIGRALGVAKVLEGSVRRADNHLRVTASLLDARTGYQIWTRSFDRGADDLANTEDEIAEAVVTSVKGALVTADANRLSLGGTANPTAFNAMLVGMARVAGDTPDVRQSSLVYFSQAIAADPGYAMAYAKRSWADDAIAGDNVADLERSRELLQDGLRDAEEAIRLAPDLGEAHAALGYALCIGQLDCKSGAREAALAVSLAPGDARILMRSAYALLDAGHQDEAVAVGRRAAALDPLAPQLYRGLSHILSITGHYADAVTAVDRMQALPGASSEEVGKHRGLVALFSLRYEAAAVECPKHPDYLSETCEAIATYRIGRHDEARATLARLMALAGDNCAYQYAEIYASWGDMDEAVRWLNKAWTIRDPGLSEMRADPWLATLGDRPEFKTIATQIGLY